MILTVTKQITDNSRNATKNNYDWAVMNCKVYEKNLFRCSVFLFVIFWLPNLSNEVSSILFHNYQIAVTRT